MASQTGHGPDPEGADMAEHVRTWHGFLTFMKWQVIAAVVLLAILAIFRTHG